jgi:uncharacterized protein (TIGR02453 family)
MEKINSSTLRFLKDLSLNNDREWFNKNKTAYLAAHTNMCLFIDALITEMNKHDQLEPATGKQSLFRIYRDVRFSQDKVPYNPRFAFGLQRATRLKRGGYYVNIKPGGSMIGCGFFGPNPGDLKRIRSDIAANYKQWNKILNSKGIKSAFGEITGEKVNSAPRGYSVDHPAIGLLRHKQFILKHEFADKEVLSPDFLKKVNNIFKSVRPYFNYMSDVLSTNENGENIV